ncbi:hypothetical protein [Nocardia sp. NPDC005366]|uniref:hypothetical protein n=1 Tax=Nocardia sp. NPDC005366 TaxID=3156878 RepID=UPI0033A445CE
MATVASTLRIPVKRSYDIGGISGQIIAAINQDDSLYLDCVDVCLHLAKSGDRELEAILETGGSVWTVNTARDGLERRVDATTKAASLHATSAADQASGELAQAWSAVYGRNPDPSDGWDHSIKAVEALLIPLVVPLQSKANLGHVAGQLKANPSKWSFGVPANDARGNGETLEGLIRHIWPNPDRHGASLRTPTQQEAESVLQIAIAIVELCRGKLVKLP